MYFITSGSRLLRSRSSGNRMKQHFSCIHVSTCSFPVLKHDPLGAFKTKEQILNELVQDCWLSDRFILNHFVCQNRPWEKYLPKKCQTSFMFRLAVADIFQILRGFSCLILGISHLGSQNVDVAFDLSLELLEGSFCNSFRELLRLSLLLLSLVGLNLRDMRPASQLRLSQFAQRNSCQFADCIKKRSNTWHHVEV